MSDSYDQETDQQSDLTDFDAQVNQIEFSIESLHTLGRDIQDIEGQFKDVIKKITIPIFYDIQDDGISKINVTLECETCIMTKDIDNFKTIGSSYTIRKNYLRFNPIFDKCNNTTIKLKNWRTFSGITDAIARSKNFCSQYKITDSTKAKQKAQIVEILKNEQFYEISVTLNCGGVNGLYVNINYLHCFLEAYFPQFQKEQEKLKQQNYLSVILQHNRTLQNKECYQPWQAERSKQQLDNNYDQEKSEKFKELIDNGTNEVVNGELIPKQKQPNTQQVPIEIIDTNDSQSTQFLPPIITPEQEQIQQQIDNNPDIKVIKKRLEQATEQLNLQQDPIQIRRLTRIVCDIELELEQSENNIRNSIKVGAVYELYIKIMADQNIYDEYHNRKYWQSSVYIGKTFRALLQQQISVLQERFFEHITGIECAIKIISNQQERESFLSQGSKLEKKYFQLAAIILQIWLNQPAGVPRYKITDIIGIRQLEGPIYDEFLLGNLEKHHIQSSPYHCRIINNQRYETCEQLLNQYVSLERSLSQGSRLSLNTRKANIYKSALNNTYIRDQVASMRFIPYLEFMNRLNPNNNFIVTTESQAVFNDIINMKDYILKLVEDYVSDSQTLRQQIETLPIDELLLKISEVINNHKNEKVRQEINRAIILYYQNKQPWIEFNNQQQSKKVVSLIQPQTKQQPQQITHTMNNTQKSVNRNTIMQQENLSDEEVKQGTLISNDTQQIPQQQVKNRVQFVNNDSEQEDEQKSKIKQDQIRSNSRSTTSTIKSTNSNQDKQCQFCKVLCQTFAAKKQHENYDCKSNKGDECVCGGKFARIKTHQSSCSEYKKQYVSQQNTRQPLHKKQE